MKKRLILLSMLAVLLVGMAAPSVTGRAQAAVSGAAVHSVVLHPAAAHVAKGRIAFVIHAGIAFFLFHHVYKLYKQGYYRGFHPIRWTKAAAEVLLGVHEVRKALDSANNSNSKILHTLAKPLNLLYAKMNGLRSNINSGNFSASQFSSIDSNVLNFEHQAAQNGLPVVESVSGL